MRSEINHPDPHVYVDELVRWFQNWGFEINPQKSKEIHIEHVNVRQFIVNGTPFPHVQEYKDLRVTVNYDLKTTENCNSVAVKSSRVF